MKRRLFFTFCACLLGFLGVSAQTWTSGTPADGVYFLYNVGYGGFLTNANDWGTRSSLDKEDGILVTLESTGDNEYTLHTSPAWKDGKLTIVGSTCYVDQTGGTTWSFSEVSTGVYNIYNGTSNYLYNNGSDTKVRTGSLADTDYYKWKLVSRQNLLDYKVSQLTDENPVDLTMFVPGHRFDKNTGGGVWNTDVSFNSGVDDNHVFAEAWDRSYDFSQTISGLPNGKYRIDTQAFYRVGGGDNSPSHAAEARENGNEVINAYVYANSTEVPYHSIFDEEITEHNTTYDSSTGYSINGTTYYVPTNTSRAGYCFERGDFKLSFETLVSTGNLTLGCKDQVGESTSWGCCKGFKIYYLGQATEVIHSLGTCTTDHAAGKYIQPNAFESVTFSFPNRVSTDDEKIALASDATITVDGNTASASVDDEENLVVTGLPLTLGTHTITIPAGAVGYLTAGVTNTEAITLSYEYIEPTVPAAVKGFLYTTVNDAPQFLSRGEDWSTRVTLSDYGIPMELSASDGDELSTLRCIDADKYLFNDGSNCAYTDGGETKWNVILNDDDTYSFSISGRYLSLESGTMKLRTSSDANNALRWQFMSFTDYETRREAAANALHENILTQAGLTQEQINRARLTAVKTATDTETTSTHEPYNCGFSRTWNLTDLAQGTYLVTLQGFMRNGLGDDVRRQLGEGLDTHLAYLSANDNTIRLKSSWEVGNSTQLSDNEAITLNGETRYIPNSTNAINYAFDNLDSYTNELLAIVGEDGKLDITLSNPSCIPYNWLPYRNLQVWQLDTNFDGWDTMDLGEVNVENDDVKSFLDAANYQYLGQQAIVDNYDKLNDKPRAIQIPTPRVSGNLTLTIGTDAEYSNAVTSTVTSGSGIITAHYNGVPGNTYYYKIADASNATVTAGQFTLTGRVRMIYTQSGSNIRDLGGRITVDGKHVRYGRLYRGGEMHLGYNTNLSDADILEMQRLGIKAELDLRCTNGEMQASEAPTASAIPDAAYYFPNIQHSGGDLIEGVDTWDYQNKIGQAIHFVAENLKEGDNVIFHCIWGADRTGAFGMLFESILGFQFTDIEEDYQLTSFSKAGLRPGGLVLDDKFAAIQNMGYTGTLQQQVVAYLQDKCGVTDEDIANIRQALLEESDAYATQWTDTLRAAYSRFAQVAGVQWTGDATTAEALTQSYNTAMQSVTQPVDITSLVVNNGFEDGTNNWCTYGGGIGTGSTDGNSIVRIYANTASLRKTLQYLPAGTYIVKAQAFDRIGSANTEGYNKYRTATQTTTSYLMANATHTLVRDIYEDYLNTEVPSGYNPAKGVYVANNSSGGAIVMAYGNHSLYWNVAQVTLDQAGCLTLGFVAPKNSGDDYNVFDNFRLYYCGAQFTAPDLTLSDTDTQYPVTEDGYYNLTTNRTLQAGKWNTVTLPFDMNAEQMQAAGITDAREMTGVTQTGERVDVNFTQAPVLRAGLPYLVQVNQDWTIQADNVLLRAKAPVSMYVNDASHNYFITGTYAPHTLSQEFFISNNMFYYADTEKPMNGLRAYITLQDIMDQSAVKSLGISLDAATSIQGIGVGEQPTDNRIYDLSGRRVSAPQRGLYIENGKKVVIK